MKRGRRCFARSGVSTPEYRSFPALGASPCCTVRNFASLSPRASMPSGFWKNTANLHRALDNAEQKLGIKEVSIVIRIL